MVKEDRRACKRPMATASSSIQLNLYALTTSLPENNSDICEVLVGCLSLYSITPISCYFQGNFNYISGFRAYYIPEAFGSSIDPVSCSIRKPNA
jgi:hypothetical protein